jgi:tetratricopeptide (TPR) repeat protein
MKTVVLTLISFIAICTSTLAQSTLAQSALTRPDSADYYFRKGMAAKSAGRTAYAYQHFEKAIRFKPTGEYFKEAGFAALELRKYEFARQHFEHAYSLNNNDTTAISQLGLLFFSLRRWNEAIRWADIMRQKQIGRYNYILGKSNYEQENYGESYKYLQAAAKDEPANAEIPYLIGRSFVDMSNYKAAVQFFDQALAKDSTKATWYYETGLTYFAIPDAKKAIVYIEKAISKGYKPTNDVIENLSNAYIEAGQPQKGIDLMKKLLEKKPADMELLWNLGEAHYKVAKYDDAIGYWDKILFYDKSNAKALYMIGLSYQKKGDKTKGQQLCDKAIQMDPSLQSYRHKKELPSGL